MAKFVIDANGLAPIAEALSGRSRVAGVAAGLKNKILAEELDAQRVKTMRGRDEYDTFRGLMDMPQGEPVSPAQAIAAFGGDGESYAKAAGKLYDNQYRSQLGDLALAEAKKGNLAGQNQYVAGYEGRAHSPIRVDGYGQTFNQDTGAVGQTAASQAKINNINANSAYSMAGVDLRGAQTQNEMQKTVSEILRGQGYDLDNQGKVVKLLEMINPQTGAASTKAPDANDARLFTSMVDDGSGRQQAVVDYDRMNKVYLFAQQNGFASVSAALPAFKQWQQEQEYITTRAGSDKVINDAIRYGSGNLTPTAQVAQGGAQNLPFSTQYDTKRGVFGEKGSIGYADNLQYYENEARKLGLPPLADGADPQQNMQVLAALAKNGAPRDHIEALAKRYLPDKW